MVGTGRVVITAVLMSALAISWPPSTPPVPGGERADAIETPNLLRLHARGPSSRVAGTPADRFVYQVDVYDHNDTKVGTVTYDVSFLSPLTLDLVNIFHFPDGDLVSHAVQAIATDASRPGLPGYRLAGVHPEGDTIDGQKSTGRYAGRTGRLHMAGWHDVNKFPDQVGFDDHYRINLNPRPRG